MTTAPTFTLVPASQMSLETLTETYNRARADYLIPMQSDAGHLAAYFHIYDVDLAHSYIALDGTQPLGLGMLGLRPGRAWLTRLGVLPEQRRSGAGGALMRALLDTARTLDRPRTILEVIQGNTPAHTLFLKFGFEPTRTLLVLRRPPGPPAGMTAGRVDWLDSAAALTLLPSAPFRLPWTNEPETLRNAGDALGLRVNLGAAGHGWLVFRKQAALLSHFVLVTESGDPRQVGAALLAHLYARYPALESSLENIPADDLHLPALLGAGCQEAFRRIEMHLRSG